MALPLSLLSGKAGLMAFLFVVVAGGAFIFTQNIQIGRLEKQIEQLNFDKNDLIVNNQILKDNNDALKENVKKLAYANLANYKSVKSLIDERSQAQKAVNSLAAATQKDRLALARISKKIEDMLKDPKNDGPVAPVLREVIREIQKEREAK